MVSVCMATYNGEKYVAEQLRSILVQLQPNDEVVISDDGSTDETCAIIESFNDSRIRLLHNNSHDIKANFQNALLHAQGDIIFLADQDDVWLEGKYEACCTALKECDLVVHDNIITDSHLQPICTSFFAENHSRRGVLHNMLRTSYWGACMAFRRHIFLRSLPFPATLALGHDSWMGLVAELTGKVAFIPVPYLLYRRHENTATNPIGGIFSRSKRSLFAKIWDRIIVSIIVIKFYTTYHAR